MSLYESSKSQSECGTCLQIPPGTVPSPFLKDIKWHYRQAAWGAWMRVLLGWAGRGWFLTVACNEVTRWEQNNKSFDFEVIFFPISYLFLLSCVNIFILLWSSNNIWIVMCRMYGRNVFSCRNVNLFQEGVPFRPLGLFIICAVHIHFHSLSNMGLFEICKR